MFPKLQLRITREKKREQREKRMVNASSTDVAKAHLKSLIIFFSIQISNRYSGNSSKFSFSQPVPFNFYSSVFLFLTLAAQYLLSLSACVVLFVALGPEPPVSESESSLSSGFILLQIPLHLLASPLCGSINYAEESCLWKQRTQVLPWDQRSTGATLNQKFHCRRHGHQLSALIRKSKKGGKGTESNRKEATGYFPLALSLVSCN